MNGTEASHDNGAVRAQALACFLEGDRYRAAGDFHRAATAYRRGLRLEPGSAQAILNCSSLLLATRKITSARKLLTSGCSLFPDIAPLRSNLLLTSLYDPTLSPAERASLHIECAESIPRLNNSTSASSKLPRLRVGYVSANFCSNPELFFTVPLLNNHNRRKFEVYLYSSVVRPDEQTMYFESIADRFRSIALATDDQAYRLIRRDDIHILIDLTGHFAGGRLGLFARRAAPIQVSFPTYPSTTGIPGMDYRLGDEHTDPTGTSEALYSEELIRIRRCYCCYQPPPTPPERELPACSNGYVTFGIFNRPAKVTNEMLRLCARILARVTDSRLLFHHTYNGSGVVSETYRKPIERVFQKEGIDPARLMFTGGLPLPEHLQAIARADIALDTFPYNGMTTTCECYWMGVPVVVLEGASHASRVGVSLASTLRLGDWIAQSADEYVERAVAKASDISRLNHLRRGLRKRMVKSPLTDGDGYARAVEEIYSRIWNAHVASRDPQKKDPVAIHPPSRAHLHDGSRRAAIS